MGFLSGKASKSTSSNQAYPYLQNAYSGTVDTGVNANNAIAGLLGVGGDASGAQQGYQNFLNSSGYNNILNQSMRGVTGSAAARGMLNSGSTLKALQTTGANLGSNYFSNYLSQLGGLSQTGLNAGQLIGGAGQTSTSKGGTQGLLGSIGALGQGIGGFATLSDKRLKRSIRKIGKLANGLNVYSYKYIWGFKKHVGVMAQEVAQLCPHALGPRWFGFMSVRYDLLQDKV
jgi:hypothetical protein